MELEMRNRNGSRGFTLLELIMAMALFAFAAVGLAGALNTISLSVVDSIADAEVRDSLRAAVLEATKDPAIQEGTRETNPDDRGIYFRIEAVRLQARVEDGSNLDGLFEVKVTALRSGSGGRVETLDWATTYTNPNLL